MNSPRIVQARKKPAEYGTTIDDAATFYLDYLERIRRCNVTIAELAREVVEAKRKDGMSATCIGDLKKRLATFTADFGETTAHFVTNTDCLRPNVVLS